MKTVIVTKYGGPEVLEIIETKKPVPKSDEILVKIKAFGVTSGDVRIRSAKFPKGFNIPARLALGFFGPRKKVLGSEFSGVVEQIGDQIKSFKPGDKVMGFRVFDVYSEYVCLKDTDALVLMPENLTFQQAAGVPFGTTTALYFLNMVDLESAKNILINGASGAVGSSAVQLAKARQYSVTGVCSSRNQDFVKSLGADHTVDYKNTDIKKIDAKYDVIFDTVGNFDFDDYKHLLNNGGVFLPAVASFGNLLSKKSREDGKKFLTGTAPENKQDLLAINQLISLGSLRPSIDKVFAFQDIKKAHEYVETGRKKGSVVVVFQD